MKNRVAAVVFNNVLRDGRVLKQAKTLKDNGYDIEIFGIQDNNNKIHRQKTPDELWVTLVDWQKYYSDKKKYSNTVKDLTYTISFFVVFSVLYLKFSSWIVKVDPHPYVFVMSFIYIFIVFIILRSNYSMIKKKGGFKKGAYFKSTIMALSRQYKIWDSIYKGLLFFYKLRRYSVWEKYLISEIVEYRPDIVHCHDLFTVNIGLEVKRRTGAKVVYDSHEVFTKLSNSIPLWDWWYSRIELKVSSKINAFVTINQSIADYLKNKYPALPDATIVRNAARLPENDFAYDGRLHGAAGLPLNRRILLYQGGYSSHRGLIPLVRSVEYLPAGWTIVFMGWGSLESELKRLTSKNDPEGIKIKFVDPVPQSELVHWSSGATVGIIPYENVSLNHWYCTPNKLWEYPAAGVPILCSPFPELVKVVEGFGVGWFIDDPVTPEGIASVLSTLSDQEIKIKKVACANFLKEDNWSCYEHNLVEMYRSLT